ncbi:MAG: antibiotic biosynthesis monooxygenase [Porticoccaceae bacterium]|nr:antibiotic biosynthesis monooxygenase [Porticoccaceae bacterium]
MNRFKIAKGKEQEFIELWKNRNTYLEQVPGFKRFHLLAGPVKEGYALFASHSEWDCRDSFDAWTRSEAFRKAHANAGGSKGIYLEPPQLELFESAL